MNHGPELQLRDCHGASDLIVHSQVADSIRNISLYTESIRLDPLQSAKRPILALQKILRQTVLCHKIGLARVIELILAMMPLGTGRP